MSSTAELETTIDKILDSTRQRILAEAKSALKESQTRLSGSLSMLESEYEKIVSDGRKESGKVARQIVGGTDLESRNRLLLAVEEAVGGVFAKALDRIAGTPRDDSYAGLTRALLEESIRVLGTPEVVIHANSKDAGTVGSLLADFPGAELSPDPIECLGGIRIRSKDGSMAFDNTIDAKIERLKPLIRKGIVSKFEVSE